MIEIRSSWIVDDRGVRPLGMRSQRLGDTSIRLQRFRERVAQHGSSRTDRKRT